MEKGVLVVDVFPTCNNSLALAYLRYLFAKMKNMDFLNAIQYLSLIKLL